MEILINYLATFLYNKTKNNEFINFEDTQKIISVFTDYYLLNKYIKKMYKISNLDNNYYSFENGEIGINLDYISNYKKKQLNSTRYFNKEFENILAINLFILSSIVHEITHALQFKKINEENIDLEKQLLIESFEEDLLLLNKNNMNYTRREQIRAMKDFYNTTFGYKTYPSERMANIISTKLENLIVKDKIFNEFTNIKEYEKNRLNIAYKIGYKNSLSPTIYFLKKKKEILENLFIDTKRCDDLISELKSASKNLDFFHKSYYGLKITPIDKLKILIKNPI